MSGFCKATIDAPASEKRDLPDGIYVLDCVRFPLSSLAAVKVQEEIDPPML